MFVGCPSNAAFASSTAFLAASTSACVAFSFANTGAASATALSYAAFLAASAL